MFSRQPAVYLLLILTGLLYGLRSWVNFPRPGLYDLSRLQGTPSVTLVGRVIDLPMTKWGHTRFVFEGQAEPLTGFKGRVLVTASFDAGQVAPGDQLCLRGWLGALKESRVPGAFSELDYWRNRRVYTKFTVWQPQALEALPSKNYLGRAAYQFRRRFCGFWQERLGVDETALLLGVTMGGRGLLPAALKEACIRAGVYHIVVVSGQNMSLIISVILVTLGIIRLRPQMALLLCLPPILLYTLAVGADPPVVRASVSALVVLTARALRRDIPSIYPLTLAAWWILLNEPSDLFGASFQLSFGASASLLALKVFEREGEIESRWKRWLREAIVVSLAVHLGIGPILVFYFQRLSLAGMIANCTIFPLTGALMVVGLAVGSIGAAVPEWIPTWVSEPVGWLAQVTLKVVFWLAQKPWATVDLPAPKPLVFVVYYLALFGILLLFHRRKINAQNLPVPARRNRL